MKYKKLTVLLLLLALSLQLFACAAAPAPRQPQGSETPSQTDDPSDTPTAPTGYPAQPLGGEGKSKEPDAAFAAASAEFAANLLKHAADSGKNAVVSPYSVLIALAMTANGASGETRTQMEAVLGLSVAQLNAYLLACGQKNTNELNAANAIWLREDYPVSEDFLQCSRDYYGAEVTSAAFNSDTRDRINDWVNYQTRGMIEKILDDMDPDAVMYLVNALAFKASWKHEYTESDARPEIFHGASGDRQATLMYADESYYLHDENTAGFLKDYENDRFCYVALLPDKSVSLEDYVASLTGEKLTALIANASNESIHTVMPKFTNDCSFELSEALQAMGMTDAFDKEKADFSGMSSVADETALRIGRVLHKTFLRVNETGTEAAAATAVEMIAETTALPREKKTVRVDRPFVCGIYDRETQSFLFLGAIYDV